MKENKMIKFIAGYIWTQIQTTIHKINVLRNIVIIVNIIDPPDKWKLYRAGLKHDLSKYRWSEAKHFAKTIFDLKHSTYGTKEYQDLLDIIKPAIDFHYKRNSHHPEYHKNGISDMSELELLELLADWLSACKRHKDGDILKSIEINQKRFRYSDETKKWMLDIIKKIT